jgi:hypothetical protein
MSPVSISGEWQPSSYAALSTVPAPVIAACAAASRAIGTRGAEHET